jgi:hypothetical protein
LHCSSDAEPEARGAAIRVTRADSITARCGGVAARVVGFLTSTQRPPAEGAREMVIVEPSAAKEPM